MPKEPFRIQISESFSSGYLWAVTGAAVSSAIFLAIYTYASGGESASGLSFATRLLHLAILAIIIFCIFWAAAFVTAIIPFSIAYYYSRRWNMRNIWHSIAFGAITGAILCPLMPHFTPDLYSIPPIPESTFLEWYLYALPLFLVGGSFGGFTYWYKSRNSQQENNP